MSKKSVWNKGKHNGGGGSPKAAASKTGTVAKNSGAQSASTSQDGNHMIDTNNPINRVVRMNRENWVERQAPVKRDTKKE
jgi:hypothetical protein